MGQKVNPKGFRVGVIKEWELQHNLRIVSHLDVL